MPYSLLPSLYQVPLVKVSTIFGPDGKIPVSFKGKFAGSRKHSGNRHHFGNFVIYRKEPFTFFQKGGWSQAQIISHDAIFFDICVCVSVHEVRMVFHSQSPSIQN
jgi:hypothetical protein